MEGSWAGMLVGLIRRKKMRGWGWGEGGGLSGRRMGGGSRVGRRNYRRRKLSWRKFSDFTLIFETINTLDKLTPNLKLNKRLGLKQLKTPAFPFQKIATPTHINHPKTPSDLKQNSPLLTRNEPLVKEKLSHSSFNPKSHSFLFSYFLPI